MSRRPCCTVDFSVGVGVAPNLTVISSCCAKKHGAFDSKCSLIVQWMMWGGIGTVIIVVLVVLLDRPAS